jgi:peptidoglycan/xylan/chitin deacetylase (PgdA/CDA1 family)
MGTVLMPNGYKCAAVLTFDFDAQSLWLGSLGVSSPTYLSRGEYGAVVGAPRILDLLDKYNIKSTWFVPGHTADSYPDVVKEVHRRGHEIGHHGYCHESPVKFTREEEDGILTKGAESLERVTGEKPRGYRSPAWDLSPNSVDLFVEHGFVYDSSQMANDFTPYRLRNGDQVSMEEGIKFGEEVNVIEIPVTWGLDDFPQFEFLLFPTYLMGLSNPSKVKESWLGDFDYCYDHIPGGVWVLTMHPQCIGRGHRMIMLEEIIEYINGKAGVWWTTMIEVANAWKPD